MRKVEEHFWYVDNPTDREELIKFLRSQPRTPLSVIERLSATPVLRVLVAAYEPGQ